MEIQIVIRASIKTMDGDLQQIVKEWISCMPEAIRVNTVESTVVVVGAGSTDKEV